MVVAVIKENGGEVKQRDDDSTVEQVNSFGILYLSAMCWAKCLVP